MNTSKKGFWRGVIYPIIAIGLQFVLYAIIHTGWLSDAGALALTGFIAWVDHTVLDVDKVV